MIDCPNGDIRDLLPDLVHGRLDGAQRELVEAHVATCVACQDELALLRDLRGTMQRAPAVDPGAIAAAIPPYRAPARRTWTSWRAAAAIATIAIGGTSIVIANRHPSAHRPTTIAELPTGTTRQPAPKVSRPEQARPADSMLVAESPARAVTPGAQIDAQPTRELAMGSGTVSELSDRELTALLNDIETLDALPSADVETALPVTPLAPTRGAR